MPLRFMGCCNALPNPSASCSDDAFITVIAALRWVDPVEEERGTVVGRIVGTKPCVKAEIEDRIVAVPATAAAVSFIASALVESMC